MKNLYIIPLGFSIALPLLSGCAHEKTYQPPTAAQYSAELARQYPDSDQLAIKTDPINQAALQYRAHDGAVPDGPAPSKAQGKQVFYHHHHRMPPPPPKEPAKGIVAPVPNGLSSYIVTGPGQPTHDVTPEGYGFNGAYDRYLEGTRSVPDDIVGVNGATPDTVDVVQGGRYALVATRASSGQTDLLEQTIMTDIPPTSHATVEDAMNYVLKGTGFDLCPPASTPESILYSRPLPAEHYHLGPMPLRQAMQILAGNAFVLQVDPIARTFCYTVRDQHVVELHDAIQNPPVAPVITPSATPTTTPAGATDTNSESTSAHSDNVKITPLKSASSNDQASDASKEEGTAQ